VASWELRAAFDNAAIMSMGNLCVAVWMTDPSVEAVNAISDVYRDLYERYPDGFVVCVIVENAVPLPEEPVRKAISGAMKGVQSRVIGMCGVQEATGFRGAALRSVITALVMMSRVPYKTATVATVAEASNWLAPFLVPGTTPAQISSAITQFRLSVAEKRKRSEL
jgi:hypothetical protein